MLLDRFLTVDKYQDESMSPEKNFITLFNITMYILNRLDDHNNTQTRNHLTNPDNPSEILYDPYKCWSYLKKRLNEITEDKLTAVTKSLHLCCIMKSDSLLSYLDKFQNIVREYYHYSGKMPDTQAAQILIMSLPQLSETTVGLIHATVTPLSRKDVSDYLRQYEQRHDWTLSAIHEVKGVYSLTSSRNKKSNNLKCSKSVCVGPHPEKDCWYKPENFKKNEKCLARRRGNPSASYSYTSNAKTKGWKKVTHPSANSVSNSESMTFHTVFKDVTASTSAVQTDHTKWALHDTGPTNHVFKHKDMFDQSSFKEHESSSKQLKLAGGEVSLNMKGVGSVNLKAGDELVFDLKDCLWVPDLTHNLVAGGLLKAEGVKEVFNDKDPSHFALVEENLAIFNGHIGQDNLMHIQLD